VDRYNELPDILGRLLNQGAGKHIATGHLDDVHYVAPPEAMPTNNSHLVTIHKGCDYRCTYCIVPETRGPQREKAPDIIQREIAGIVDFGGDEVTLLGQNVTAYRHKDMDFADLLREISGIDGLKRIRFLTGHPRDMDEKLIRAVGDLDKVCPWLHVPAQSGSNRILRKMKRLYTREDYLKMVADARKWIRDVTFSGDFIVGFPGESDDDFRQTLELIREVRYDQTFNFKYSERPGTPAAKLPDDVPEQVKKDRLAELLDLQEKIWEDTAQQSVGQDWTVVCEGDARRPAGAIKCRTANNRKVLLENVSGRPGDSFRVHIKAYRLTTFVGQVLQENER
jgi:tRNA-2-methylthio-N6-dimethylallyladenosine synthase